MIGKDFKQRFAGQTLVVGKVKVYDNKSESLKGIRSNSICQ